MMSWLNENAGAVQTIATCVLVLVTLAYVLLTRSISQATRAQAVATLQEVEATHQEVEVTRRLAESSSAQAEASREQVNLTKSLVESALAQTEVTKTIAAESQRARALLYLPVVLAEFAGSTGNKVKVKVANHGSGSAFSILLQWIAMEGHASVGGGPLLNFAASLRSGDSITGEIPVDPGEATRVLSQYGSNALAFKCQYADIHGAEYESHSRAKDFSLEGLNEPGRFALGQQGAAPP